MDFEDVPALTSLPEVRKRSQRARSLPGSARRLAVFLALSSGCAGSPFTATSNTGSSGAAALNAAGESAMGGQPGSATNDAGADGANLSGGSAGQPYGGAGESGSSVNGGGHEAGSSGEAGDSCPSQLDGPLQLGFFPELSANTTQAIHPFFELSNAGESVSLDRISIRYYFTNESTNIEVASCYWVTGDHCSLLIASFHDVATPTASASRYLELQFRAGSKLTLGAEPLEVRVGFTAANADLLQTNDYSFDDAAQKPTSALPFPYKPWPKATLYVDEKLVWGNEPCPKG